MSRKNKPCDLHNLRKTTISPKKYKERIKLSKKLGYILNPNVPNGKYAYVIRKNSPKLVYMISKQIEMCS